MKYLFMNLIRIGTVLSVAWLTGPLSFAGGVNEKVVEKARYAVEQAAPDDWHTLAQSAEKCIRKGVNLKEAVAWLEQSLRIKRTDYNLEVQGDYFAQNQLPTKAICAYAESYRRGVLAQKDYRKSEIYEKIKREVLKLGKSFDGDLQTILSQELSHVQTGAELHKILGYVW